MGGWQTGIDRIGWADGQTGIDRIERERTASFSNCRASQSPALSQASAVVYISWVVYKRFESRPSRYSTHGF